MNYNFSPLEIGVNRSFNCHSHLSAFNVTGSLDGAEYDLPLGSDLTNIQIQAYNEIIGERDFVDCKYCFRRLRPVFAYLKIERHVNILWYGCL